jgi:predicted RNA-binding protein with PUA-like domain
MAARCGTVSTTTRPRATSGRWRWAIKPVTPVKNEVTLRQIKDEPRLQHLALVRQSRLSVSPIDADAWRLMCQMAGVKP